MKILIRAADLDHDRELLIGTISRYLTPDCDANRFDWLYRQNPHGPARAWLATDAETGETLGASAAFSRRARVRGRETTGCVLGDFCVADKCRSLGPAMQLQRATLDAVGSLGGAEFSFDLPSLPMAAIYKRIGISPAAKMVRLAKPLRVDRKLQELGVEKNLAQPANWIGNFLLQACDYRMANNRSTWDIARHEGECGEEFTALWKRIPPRNGIEIQKSAEYLNWRYLRHPSVRYHVLTARKAGDMQGYLVFTCGHDGAQIAEWCTGDDTALLGALIANLAFTLRKGRTLTLSAFLLNSDPRLPLFKKMGFWPRESSPFMVYWPGVNAQTAGNWFLMHGDRDI